MSDSANFHKKRSIHKEILSEVEFSIVKMIVITRDDCIKHSVQVKKNSFNTTDMFITNHKTNKMTCAPSEDSDQPGNPPSLIRVFTVCMKKRMVLNYPLSAL